MSLETNVWVICNSLKRIFSRKIVWQHKVWIKSVTCEKFSRHYIWIYSARNLYKFSCKNFFFQSANLGGSVGDLRLLGGSSRSIPSFGNSSRMTKRLNQAAAAVELELYSMVGRLEIEIKGFIFLSSLVRCSQNLAASTLCEEY